MSDRFYFKMNAIQKDYSSDLLNEAMTKVAGVIGRLESTYKTDDYTHFTKRIVELKKDMQILSKCTEKMRDNNERSKRVQLIKEFNRRINEMESTKLTAKTTNEAMATIFNSPHGAPKESEADTRQLLVRETIKKQDEELELISQSLDRLKVVSGDIGDELKAQNNLIDVIVEEVEVADSKLHFANRNIKKLLLSSKNNSCCYIITFLIIVLVAVVIISVVLSR